MANFEGKLNLNVETSEIEINGKFQLSEEELDRVSGGTQTGLVSIPFSVSDSEVRARISDQTMTPNASGIPSTLAPDPESTSDPLNLGLKSEYEDNFNMPNQVRWERFDLER